MCGVMTLPGAQLILDTDVAFPKILDEELRCTVDGRPRSARLVPEEERWKLGCWGLLGARDMREEETERA